MTNLVAKNPAPVLINNAGAVGAPSLSQSFTDQRYPLGSIQEGSNGQRFMYVYASASVAVNLLVAIQPDFNNAGGGNANGQGAAKIYTLGGTSTTLTNIVNGPGPLQVGVTDQGAIGAAQYGWITIAGVVSVKVKKGTHLKKSLFVSTTTGWATTTQSALASARAVRAWPQIFGARVMPNPASSAAVIGVLGTATSSGDVRPVYIVATGAWLDRNVLEGFNV